MKRIFPVDYTLIVFLSDKKVKLINMTPCQFMLIQQDNPNAKLAIEEMDGSRSTVTAGTIRIRLSP